MKIADLPAGQSEVGPTYACCGKPMREQVTRMKANGKGTENVLVPVDCGCPRPVDTQDPITRHTAEQRTVEAMETIAAMLTKINARMESTDEPKSMKVAR